MLVTAMRRNPAATSVGYAALERFLRLCLVVAGKNASVQEKKLDTFLEQLRKDTGCDSPFAGLRALGKNRGMIQGTALVRKRLEAVKLGQYTRLVQAFVWIALESASYPEIWKDLRNPELTRDYLLQIPGLGWKTASFFLTYSTRGVTDLAVLDTHILAWMRETGLAPDAPKASPVGKIYIDLERRFVAEARRQGKTVTELDFEIWKQRRTKPKIP